MGLGEILTVETIDEPGPEAVTLEGIVLQDPGDPATRLAIARIRISDLDLVGLTRPEGPSRFSIAFEGIDYSGLADGLRSYGILPLPDLATRPTLTLALSLLPSAGGEGSMTGRFLGQIDRQLGSASR